MVNLPRKRADLETALRKVDPKLEKAVRQVVRRSAYIGMVLGFLFGVLAASVVISINVHSKLVSNPQPVQLFGFGTSMPHLSADAPLVGWMDVNAGDYNGQPVSVFFCPTPYGVRLLPVVGDVNDDIVSYMVGLCKTSQSLRPEVNG